MAATGTRNDPLASFNFIVTIENVRAGFSEISGLSTETDVIEYREGSDPIHMRKLPGKFKVGNINCKRGYTANGVDLWTWRKSVMDGKPLRLSGTITLRNEAQQAALTWQFTGGWPSKWAGPAFNAKNNEVAIEELEICVETLALMP